MDGIAYGARRGRDDLLDAARIAVTAELVERVEGALHGILTQAAILTHALREANDFAELIEMPIAVAGAVGEGDELRRITS